MRAGLVGASSTGVPSVLLVHSRQRPPWPQNGTPEKITPNFKNADLAQVAESVSAVTGKNFVFDPRVHAEVTMLSSKPLDPQAFYQAFLSILQVYGFIAVPAGDIIKILPDANARQFASIDLPDHINPDSDEIVTQVIDVKNVGAAQLVPILRPMMPQYAHLAAYPSSNIIVLSDRASNVNRMVQIIRRIDKVGDQDVEVVSLENASSNETARLVNALYQQAAAAEGGGGTPVKVVADDRSNSVVISGDQSQRLRLRALIAHLDTPLKRTGNTRVRYLRFANAEKIAPKLKEQITGIAQATASGGGGGTTQATPQSQAEKNALVWADPETNALIITAPPDLMSATNVLIEDGGIVVLGGLISDTVTRSEQRIPVPGKHSCPRQPVQDPGLQQDPQQSDGVHPSKNSTYAGADSV